MIKLIHIFTWVILLSSNNVWSQAITSQKSNTVYHFLGIGAFAGGNSFFNPLAFDNSFYHFPSQFMGGISIYHNIHFKQRNNVIFELGIAQHSYKMIAKKYNNTWATLEHTILPLSLSAYYRYDFGKHNLFYIQNGMSLSYVIAKHNSFTGSEHNNNNDVRDYTRSLKIGQVNRYQLYYKFSIGGYLDAGKMHDVSIFLHSSLSNIFKAKHFPSMKADFMFSDNSTAQYTIDIKGMAFHYGIQYIYWF
jgi:hypothetical protein